MRFLANLNKETNKNCKKNVKIPSEIDKFFFIWPKAVGREEMAGKILWKIFILSLEL
jgi:hypothetical protein